MKIDRLDHLVLTVSNLEKTIAFYECVLGMKNQTYANGRVALIFGAQKINLHEFGKEYEPKSTHPTPGSADLCFITATKLNDAIEHVKRCSIEIISGPVQRSGAYSAVCHFILVTRTGI